MPKMQISKSIRIDAPANRVAQTLGDFDTWTVWSPWLIQEPEAKVTVAADGRSYAWEGDRVGSGNMQITDETPGESIHYDLNFLKPWKSSAKTWFELRPDNGSTEVTWVMDSSLPFYLFWMKKMMMAFIGMDYERGLAMLKDFVEDGEVHSKLDFQGYSDFPGWTYLGVRTACTKETVGPRMQEDFARIDHFLEAHDHDDLLAGPAFSIYHKWDMVKDRIEYTSAVVVREVPGDLPADMVSGEIPPTRVYSLLHTGPYAHLGNAWTTMYNLHRNKVFKLNKKIDPFEVYLDDPQEVAGKALRTEVRFAVK